MRPATSPPGGGANCSDTKRWLVVIGVQASITQSAGQLSLSLLFPSSHVSPALTVLLPQSGGCVVELVEVLVLVLVVVGSGAVVVGPCVLEVVDVVVGTVVLEVDDVVVVVGAADVVVDGAIVLEVDDVVVVVGAADVVVVDGAIVQEVDDVVVDGAADVVVDGTVVLDVDDVVVVDGDGTSTAHVTPDAIGLPSVSAASSTRHGNSPAAIAAAPSQLSKWTLKSSPSRGEPGAPSTTILRAWSKSFGLSVEPKGLSVKVPAGIEAPLPGMETLPSG